jgi:hypothetical protein
MKLSQVKLILPTLNELKFKLEDGTIVPAHFHITEVGMVSKLFIDCGGTIRTEKRVNLQLWSANDVDHQLMPNKLLQIIELSEQKLGIEDQEIEVEYQSATIGKYALAFDGSYFLLQNTQTACLAEDQCGIPPQKQKINLAEINQAPAACCTPGSNCC